VNTSRYINNALLLDHPGVSRKEGGVPGVEVLLPQYTTGTVWQAKKA
jgi:hypothetical protein